MRFLLFSGLLLAVVGALPGAAQTAPKPGWYVATHPEPPDEFLQIPAAVKLEARGKEYRFTGLFADPAHPGQRPPVKGTYNPWGNRLTGTWEQVDPAGKRVPMGVEGSYQTTKGMLEVKIQIPYTGPGFKQLRFLCRRVAAAPKPELWQPAASAGVQRPMPVDGRWWALVDMTVDPDHKAVKGPWTGKDRFGNQQQGNQEYRIQKDELSWTVTHTGADGTVTAEWTGTWHFDPAPEIIRSDDEHSLKLKGTCQVLKAPANDPEFAFWSEARYETNKNELHPARALWNGIQVKYPVAQVGHYDANRGGQGIEIPGGVIKETDATFRLNLGDSWSEVWNAGLMGGKIPEYLVLKQVANGFTVTIYRYKFRAKPLPR